MDELKLLPIVHCLTGLRKGSWLVSKPFLRSISLETSWMVGWSLMNINHKNDCMHMCSAVLIMQQVGSVPGNYEKRVKYLKSTINQYTLTIQSIYRVATATFTLPSPATHCHQQKLIHICNATPLNKHAQ